jgi:hypothetical protein
MEPYAEYALQQPQALPLPGWARAFRAILLGLGGLLAVLTLILTVSATGSRSLTTEGGISTIQLAIYLSLIIFVLSGPYLVGSIVYGVTWAASLRGKGYRAYSGTTWILVAGPILVGVVVLAAVAFLFRDPSSF